MANVDDQSFSKPETVTLLNTTEGRKYYINIGSSSIIDFTEGTFKLEVTTNLNTNEFYASSVKVYPNPTNDFLNLENSQNLIAYEIKDVAGRTIRKQKYNGKQIDVQTLTKGVYILKLQTKDNQFITLKFMKK
ncbi:Por secretion system C-terminal sorting domain [Weeksella virosa]|uniref:T9SS type A sorting domain-containing protein n=1 Tax=Weeksella virosa TaxID=1014 RepID=UPI000E00AF59|nr:T9SS type A sorting domain-containing protein [Weeksella virosa]SUP52126.1 Por secretion system C-terminal sorting domain [Weeksella virosa]